MTRSTAHLSLRLALLGAMVAAALTLGGRQAFAANAALTCPNDGWNTMGACVNNADCTIACLGIHSPPVEGRCLNGCCRCLF